MTCVLRIIILTSVMFSCYVSAKCTYQGLMDRLTGLCAENDTNADVYKNDKFKESDNPSKVTSELNMSMEYNQTGNIMNENDVRNSSVEVIVDTSTLTPTDLPFPPSKDQHITIIIVGPTAAVSIALFLCIAYYFHNAQLNKKAKRLSFTIYVSPEHSTDSAMSDTPRLTRVPSKSIPNSPRASLKLSREASPSPRFSREASPNAWLAVDNADVFGQRRKSTLTGNTLSVPGNIQGKRGSQNWNAFADHEILTLSAPRRHSTFII